MNSLLNLTGHGDVLVQFRLLIFLWLGCSGSPAFHRTRKVFFLDRYFKNINLTRILRTFASNEYICYFRKKNDDLKDNSSTEEPEQQSAILFTWNFCSSGKIWLETQSPLSSSKLWVLGEAFCRVLALVDSGGDRPGSTGAPCWPVKDVEALLIMCIKMRWCKRTAHLQPNLKLCQPQSTKDKSSWPARQ